MTWKLIAVCAVAGYGLMLFVAWTLMRAAGIADQVAQWQLDGQAYLDWLEDDAPVMSKTVYLDTDEPRRIDSQFDRDAE